MDERARASGISAECWYCMKPGYLYRHGGGYNIPMCDACRNAQRPEVTREEIGAFIAYGMCRRCRKPYPEHVVDDSVAPHNFDSDPLLVADAILALFADRD